jgi:hypothetical protein
MSRIEEIPAQMKHNATDGRFSDLCKVCVPIGLKVRGRLAILPQVNPSPNGGKGPADCAVPDAWVVIYSIN